MIHIYLNKVFLVTSNPGIHDQVHSTEEWSYLRSNPLELSSSLRSNWLTEDYYVSLALVFKSVGRPQDSQYGTKLPDAQGFVGLQW
jgi:hypothetical protein